MFLPEPKSFQAILKHPPEIRKLPLNATGSESENLISNDIFQLEQPQSDDQVIPTMFVIKCKSKSDGTMETLKARVVARGDIQHRDEFTDTWSSHISMKGLRMFLAMTAKLLKRVKQADFIGAYIQAKDQGRFFIRSSEIYKQYFPTMSKYFGRPQRLRKAIYSLTLSGKYGSLSFQNGC
eukprot:1275624-Ditylum_brightwellii.AAC.1